MECGQGLKEPHNFWSACYLLLSSALYSTLFPSHQGEQTPVCEAARPSQQGFRSMQSSILDIGQEEPPQRQLLHVSQAKLLVAGLWGSALVFQDRAHSSFLLSMGPASRVLRGTHSQPLPPCHHLKPCISQ